LTIYISGVAIMKSVLLGVLACFLMISMAFGGQNENASILADLNYNETGNQGVTQTDAPGVGIRVYFEVRIANSSQLDTYGFEVVYQKDDFIFEAAWADNVKSDDEEQNLLRVNGANLIDPGLVVDSTNAVASVRFSRSSTNTVAGQAPSGEGLLALFRFKTKVAAPRSITFRAVDWYDVDGIKDECKAENLGEVLFGGGSLPVELSSFHAIYSEARVELQWITESESNSWGFNVYRSLDKDKNYSQINARLIKAAGNSTQRRIYRFQDNRVEEDITYWYQLQQIDIDGATQFFGPISMSTSSAISHVPQLFDFYENYPNPFNPSTTLQFDLPSSEHVLMEIFDISGKKVKTLVDEQLSAGSYPVLWDGTNFDNQQVSAGAYFCRIIAGSFQQVNKMMLLK
jgi:hypothetical protein